MQMKRGIAMVLGVFALAACGPDVDAEREALRNDLAADLAAASLMSEKAVASPLEAGLDTAAAAVAEAPAPAAPKPAPARTSTARRKAPSAARSNDTYRAPARTARTETVRHTGRDAAIGAGAGAVIGAVAAGKGDRVKGAVVGGVVGGAIGAVIGHTVDKKERVVYQYASNQM